MENPVARWLFRIFLILNLVDIVTAFFILPGEANPLFLLSGSIFIVLIIKILVVYGVWYYTRRNIYPSNFYYYLMIMFMMLGSLAVAIGSYNNIQGILHPEYVEAAKDIPKEVKYQAYGLFVSFIYIIPLGLSMLGFWLYDKSIKYTRIDKDWYKKRKWWKF